MLLSSIIPQLGVDIDFEVRNEKPFTYLALTAQATAEATCVYLTNIKFLDEIKENVTMVITTEEIAERIVDKGVLVTEDPRSIFFLVHNHLSKMEGYKRERFENQIDPTAEISPQACIADHNVIIKKGAVVGPFVLIDANTVIGENSVIRAGATLGDGGFEHKKYKGSVVTVNHIGGIVIGDNVDVGHNSTIQNAIYPWSDTIIEDGCRIDNLVHVSHACHLHKRVFVVATTVIAGRTVVGEDTWIGIGASVANGLTIGSNARVNMGAVVTKNVEDGGSVSGNFAIDHQKFIQNMKKGLEE